MDVGQILLRSFAEIIEKADWHYHYSGTFSSTNLCVPSIVPKMTPRGYVWSFPDDELDREVYGNPERVLEFSRTQIMGRNFIFITSFGYLGLIIDNHLKIAVLLADPNSIVKVMDYLCKEVNV